MWFFLAFVSFIGGGVTLLAVAFPRLLGLSRRLHALGLFGVAFVCWIITMALGLAGEARQEEREHQERAATAAAPAAEETAPTMAETWAATARASLEMREEAFFPQMPDESTGTQWRRRGVDRIHTMTWPDGSVVVTHWRPSEVPGDGLRLYFIEQIGAPK